jgi:hypothetical protein
MSLLYFGLFLNGRCFSIINEKSFFFLWETAFFLTGADHMGGRPMGENLVKLF